MLPSNAVESPHDPFPSGGTVLVVSSDAGLLEQVAGWVGGDGFEVVMCPGPHRPDYSCMGLRGERCPLDVVADLTVLDLHPAGADFADETGRAALVKQYQAGGRPVLVLTEDGASEFQAATAGAAFLERTADRGALLATVRELLGR